MRRCNARRANSRLKTQTAGATSPPECFSSSASRVRCRTRSAAYLVAYGLRGLIGELQHVIEALARVRHFFLGEPRQTRVEAKAIQRIPQIEREVLELFQKLRRIRVRGRPVDNS